MTGPTKYSRMSPVAKNGMVVIEHSLESIYSHKNRSSPFRKYSHHFDPCNLVCEPSTPSQYISTSWDICGIKPSKTRKFPDDSTGKSTLSTSNGLMVGHVDEQSSQQWSRTRFRRLEDVNPTLDTANSNKPATTSISKPQLAPILALYSAGRFYASTGLE